VEKRLHGLEGLISQLLPGIVIDEVLVSSGLAEVASPLTGSQTRDTSHSIERGSPQTPFNAPTHDPVLLEAVPSSADGFNWQEDNVTVDGLTDGMAALSVEPTGVGYLGNTLYCQICPKS
jgi:transcriptional regulatory protein GAL4